MAKSNAERQEALRKRRTEAGLVYYREWITEDEKKAVKELLDNIRKGFNKS